MRRCTSGLASGLFHDGNIVVRSLRVGIAVKHLCVAVDVARHLGHAARPAEASNKTFNRFTILRDLVRAHKMETQHDAQKVDEEARDDVQQTEAEDEVNKPGKNVHKEERAHDGVKVHVCGLLGDLGDQPGRAKAIETAHTATGGPQVGAPVTDAIPPALCGGSGQSHGIILYSMNSINSLLALLLLGILLLGILLLLGIRLCLNVLVVHRLHNLCGRIGSSIHWIAALIVDLRLVQARLHTGTGF